MNIETQNHTAGNITVVSLFQTSTIKIIFGAYINVQAALG